MTKVHIINQTKNNLMGPFLYALHCNLIHPRNDVDVVFFYLSHMFSQIGYLCFHVGFCHSTVANFDVSP